MYTLSTNLSELIIANTTILLENVFKKTFHIVGKVCFLDHIHVTSLQDTFQSTRMQRTRLRRRTDHCFVATLLMDKTRLIVLSLCSLL